MVPSPPSPSSSTSPWSIPPPVNAIEGAMTRLSLRANLDRTMELPSSPLPPSSPELAPQTPSPSLSPSPLPQYPHCGLGMGPSTLGGTSNGVYLYRGHSNK